MFHWIKPWTGVLALVGLMAGQARAAEIWTDIGNQIAKFNSDNPSVITYVGATGQPVSCDGMDFTSDGTLYGVIDRRLYLINQDTGWATPLGGDLISDPNEIFFDLSWDPSTQEMYAIAAQNGHPPELYKIDLQQPTATLVGTMIEYNDLFPPGGLATTASGERYCDSYYHIYHLGEPQWDPSGPWVPSEMLPRYEGFTKWFFGGMTVDWSRDGTCYHATLDLDSLQTELWTVDLTTGRGTFLGGIGPDPGSTILLSAAIKPVPEPAGLVMTVVVMLFMRRRRERRWSA